MTNEDNEYIIQGEPNAKTKAENWKTAIGLQQVDGLKPSQYLIETANSNINGEIDLNEATNRINAYYEQTDNRNNEARLEEADKVSLAITKILSEQAFSFGVSELFTIHKRLFQDVSDMKIHAGKIRTCNISKKEWVLNDTSIYYAHYENIKEELEYDFEKERNFDYKSLDKKQIALHLAKFISGIWQIHPFREGNTRAVAVLAIKYLRTFGFDIGNSLFEEHSWYFRNALVRSNYKDYNNGIHETNKFLDMFFENLLLGGENELKSRYLHIENTLSPDGEPIRLSAMPNTDKIPINNTDKQKSDILEFIKLKGEISTKSLTSVLNVGEERIKKLLQQLVKEGKIDAIGGNRNRTYILKRE